tara:strand:+ start:798 stop:1553 length:756 start_codon:yes stop_codon:yes gene_type:complete
MRLMKGKAAIVTGAAQGIGARLALGIALEGAKVIVADILDGNEVVEKIRAQGGEAEFIRADITDDASCEAMADLARNAFGGIDVLVNNAALFGTLPLTPLDDITLQDWDRVLQVNTRGVWQCVKAVMPSMIERGGGSIVNVATNRVFKGFPNLLHYDASKGAVLSMTKAMAAELGDSNIRVNAVAPGLTMSENVLAKEGIGDRIHSIINGRALKREQRPEDLIGPVIFLASELSAFVSGQSLVVDGGGIMR